SLPARRRRRRRRRRAMSAFRSCRAATLLCLCMACRSHSHGAAEPKQRIERIEVTDPARFWIVSGFVEMVAPIRPPTSRDAQDRSEIWLQLPDDAPLTVEPRGDGRTLLRLPAGAAVDRVERWLGDGVHRVVDVRGTR